MADPGVLNTLPLEGSNPSTPTKLLQFGAYKALIIENLPENVPWEECWPDKIHALWEVLGSFVEEVDPDYS